MTAFEAAGAECGGRAGRDIDDLVRAELLALELPGVTASDLGPDRLLIDDLGLDSLKFVDLTVALEEALGLDEFPMQEWVDDQLGADRPLSVGALIEACSHAVRAGEDPG